MARSPLTITIRKVQAIIDDVHSKLESKEEYDLFLDLLLPEPETPVKRQKRGKRASGGKSKRAAGLAERIASTQKPQLSEVPLCTTCGHVEDYEDHFQPSPHYHPFAPPASDAGRQSRRQSSSVAPAPSLETGTETVTAVGASGGGD
jgi:hypothetical protein